MEILANVDEKILGGKSLPFTICGSEQRSRNRRVIMALQLKEFPDDLKESLKIMALREHVPLHALVARLLRKALEKKSIN
jgi:hypothetical protein